MYKNLLSVDIGGTNSRLCLFNHLSPTSHFNYKSKDFSSFEGLLERAREEHPELFQVDQACFAFAGPVSKKFQLTNLPWHVDWDKIKEKFGFKKLLFLNDLEAGVYGIEALPIDSFKTLQVGKQDEGNLALISPGTGLGEAFLTKDGTAHATESGHADFAPVDDHQIELFHHVKEKYGRVSYEHILSGNGVWNIYSFLKEKQAKTMPLPEGEDKNKAVWTGAFKFHDQVCIESLRMFTTILAQEAGNLALHTLAKKGVCIGGGIVPHIMPYLEEPAFLDTFCRKGPMTPLLQSIPIKVILDDRCSLFGCAKFCLYGNH